MKVQLVTISYFLVCLSPSGSPDESHWPRLSRSRTIQTIKTITNIIGQTSIVPSGFGLIKVNSGFPISSNS